MDTQYKLQEQSQKAAAFVKMQQNNFTELRMNHIKPHEENVIFEDIEETEEDDVAQKIPKKRRVVDYEQH